MVKINQKRFTGKDKVIDVFPSFGLIEKTIELSETMTDQDINANSDDVSDQHAQMVRMLKLLGDMKSYVKTVAKLSDKELAKYVDKVDMSRIGNDIGYLTMRMQGMSDHDINLAEKKQEEITKKVEESD